MGWLRLDDGFAMHPKVAALNDRDYRAWTKVLLYCARYRTEGDVPEHAFHEITVTTPSRRRFIELGLLDVDEEGFVTVHDWSDFNKPDPTNAERQARWRERQRNAKRNAGRNALTVTDTVTRNAPSLARAQPRAGDTVPSTLLRAEEEVLSADRSEGPRAGLPIEKELAVAKLLEAIGKDADDQTPEIVRHFALGLSEASLARVTESVRGSGREVRNRAGYAVNALKSEANGVGPDFEEPEP